ncbi:MAG: branched-chain amino acid transport system substrate-binding protein [Alphaproteobacteria bacterium]|jgi:branched-chain amino acid transport system substrate-binding protein|nr:branched-chain amino acid transport system substrate-binding protein [Alphaproteobacteria bacterium]
MNRRVLLGAIAAALAAPIPAALAQEPIVFGVITPLSPPGETSLGQQVKRGSEIAVEYLNEKGGVLGRKVVLSVQDSAGKNEAGVAAYRRLVSNEKAVAVFGFIHSGVNIAVNEVAKEMGVPTMGTQTGAGDVTAKHYDIAFRTHAIDPPRAATWLGWAKKMGFKRMSILAETTDYGIGLVKATEAQNKSMNIGLEIQTIMFDRTSTDLLPQLLQVKAFKPDCIINVGVGQPLDLMISQATTIGLLPTIPMVTSYDAPARPQHWQLHKDQEGIGVHFIAFYTPKSKLSDLGELFVKKYTEKYNEPPIYSALNAFANAVVFADAIEMAKTTEPKAVIKALETGSFKGWSSVPMTFPQAEGALWHNWSPPLMIMKYTKVNQAAADADVAYTLGE